MKTFFRTTLFWLVAGIAFLVVSGFGYKERKFGPFFDQSYLVQWLPNPVIEQIEQQGREKAIQEQQLLQEQPDEQEQANLETTLLPEEVLPSEPEETPVSHLTDLLMGQATLSQQMNEQFAQISALITQQFQNATALCQGIPAVQPVPDEIAQKKAELQAQIEALQTEMNTLETTTTVN